MIVLLILKIRRTSSITIENSLDQLETYGPPEHAWDNIAPQTEQDLSDQTMEEIYEDPEFDLIQSSDRGNDGVCHDFKKVKLFTSDFV